MARQSYLYAMIASRPPAARMDPAIAAFFKDYLENEKAARFGERVVLNSHFPPFPSPAFDAFLEQVLTAGEAGPRRQLYSVTLAITNRCGYRCWHCYNAGRSSQDMSLETLQALAAELQDLGAIQITLTGGEPLLRDDVEEIASAFDERACLVLGTTGDGLTPARAQALRESGVFAVGVSLDSADETQHDRLRGRSGAWRSALAALQTAEEAGLYPYVVAVATRELLERGRFFDFLAFAGRAAAREVHLLEPSATGRLVDRRDVLLAPAERGLLFDYQREVAAREDLPVLSCFAYLESERAFGCGAGLTHLYIDGSGEVCPCNLVPLSFGNVSREPLRVILDRMGRHFRNPRPACVGCQLEGKVPAGLIPAPPDVSEVVCSRHLPEEHTLPEFFRIRAEAAARESTGTAQLRDAYDRVHDDYETFWLEEAAAPIHALVDRLGLRRGERVFEAGCGTGYATALIAEQTGAAAPYVAVDLSGGMLSEARRRLTGAGLNHVRFVRDDALEAIQGAGPFDLIFSSWVLGYIPLDEFFAAAAASLAPGGRLAFVVHRDRSPREALDLFGELIADDPSVLLRRVGFDFPRDAMQAAARLAAAGLEVIDAVENAITFRYDSPAEVLDHLLKSGAGTAYYDALDPNRRPALEREFLRRLGAAHPEGAPIEVSHEYVSCIASRAATISARRRPPRPTSSRKTP